MLCDTLDTRPYAPHDTRPSTLTRLPHLPPHQVELEIGGQKIDKITSDWLRLYSEVYHSSDEKAGYRRLVDFDNPAAGGDAGVEKRFFVPINFFFTRSPSLALPLVALQYHEVRLNFTFETAAAMALNGVNTAAEPTAVLYATFVYLDSSERKRFSQQSHEVRRSTPRPLLRPAILRPLLTRFPTSSSYSTSSLLCNIPAPSPSPRVPPARPLTCA